MAQRNLPARELIMLIPTSLVYENSREERSFPQHGWLNRKSRWLLSQWRAVMAKFVHAAKTKMTANSMISLEAVVSVALAQELY